MKQSLRAAVISFNAYPCGILFYWRSLPCQFINSAFQQRNIPHYRFHWEKLLKLQKRNEFGKDDQRSSRPKKELFPLAPAGEPHLGPWTCVCPVCLSSPWLPIAKVILYPHGHTLPTASRACEAPGCTLKTVEETTLSTSTFFISLVISFPEPPSCATIDSLVFPLLPVYLSPFTSTTILNSSWVLFFLNPPLHAQTKCLYLSQIAYPHAYLLWVSFFCIWACSGVACSFMLAFCHACWSFCTPMWTPMAKSKQS